MGEAPDPRELPGRLAPPTPPRPHPSTPPRAPAPPAARPRPPAARPRSLALRLLAARASAGGSASSLPSPVLLSPPPPPARRRLQAAGGALHCSAAAESGGSGRWPPPGPPGAYLGVRGRVQGAGPAGCLAGAAGARGGSVLPLARAAPRPSHPLLLWISRASAAPSSRSETPPPGRQLHRRPGDQLSSLAAAGVGKSHGHYGCHGPGERGSEPRGRRAGSASPRPTLPPPSPRTLLLRLPQGFLLLTKPQRPPAV